LLVSHPGTHGGYSLSRPAAGITAAEVIEAIEGPLFLTNCVSDDGLCGQFEKCNLKSPLQRLNDIVVQTFRNLTIEEMSQQQSEHIRGSLPVEPRLVTIAGMQRDI
jgi:Rrf2 family protein